MKQFLITPSAGKRLIAKALATHPTIQNALRNSTLVIIAGTTNGYLAEEILNSIGAKGFSRKRFFRGLTMPPNKPVTKEGRLADESQFPGDVVIVKGKWQKGKTIADIVDSLKKGDVIVKGANAVDLTHKQAALLIGHPKAGTAGLSLPAVVGRRVKLIVAVGLEKRVNGDLNAIAMRLNEPGADGYRFLPLPGEVFTELDALKLLCGVEAELIAAGGVNGAEGSCWIEVYGSKEQEAAVEAVYNSVANEPAFSLDDL
ncbi:MAG: hypothetical protein NWE95_06280 [Candidatus Bathyarchaeota archaeon]|nr:hypothetical protein [Candidatus Bathyarchaeota archaeon]